MNMNNDMVTMHLVHAVLLMIMFITMMVLLRWQHHPRRHVALDVLIAVAFATFAMQVVHAAEHLLQVWYWRQNPKATPWLSPWAMWGRNTIANSVSGGYRGTATEVMHLIGNGIYVLGLGAALLALQRMHVGALRSKWARRTLVVESLHAVEHVALVATLVITGSADGLTTLFGLLEPGTTEAIAMRVWLHAVLNGIVTVMGAEAMSEVLHARRRLRSAEAR